MLSKLQHCFVETAGGYRQKIHCCCVDAVGAHHCEESVQKAADQLT